MSGLVTPYELLIIVAVPNNQLYHIRVTVEFYPTLENVRSMAKEVVKQRFGTNWRDADVYDCRDNLQWWHCTIKPEYLWKDTDIEIGEVEYLLHGRMFKEA